MPTPVPRPADARAEDTPPDDLSDSRACLNCGAPLSGAYCSACGQKYEPIRQPISHFLSDSFVEFLGVDGRLWKTLGLLLFRPGQLTSAFLRGERTRYIRPLRIYLTATLLFFFLLSVFDPVGRLEQMINSEATPDTTLAAGDWLMEIEENLSEERDEAVAQELLVDSLRIRADSLRTVLAADSTRGRITDFVNEAVEEIDEETEDLASLRTSESRRRRISQYEWQRDLLADWPPDSLIEPARLAGAARLLFAESDIELNMPEWMARSDAVHRMTEAPTNEAKVGALADFFRDTIDRLPVVMFLLLPMFALLLKLIYLRRAWYYTEHLVFALHTHAFSFVVFAVIVAVIGFSTLSGWLVFAASGLVLIIPIYFYLAQKRVYEQGWFKTVLKALLLGWIYGGVLLLGGFTLALVLAAVFG